MKVKGALPQLVNANVVSQILFSISFVQKKGEDRGLYVFNTMFCFCMWMVRKKLAVFQWVWEKKKKTQ